MEATHNFLDVFFSFDDAVVWIDHHLEDHDSGWNIKELEIKYVNTGFRASVIFEKDQYEMNFEEKNMELDL